MSERHRFISQAVFEKWRTIKGVVKGKTADFVAAAVIAPTLAFGVQAPAQHDISRPAIVQTIFDSNQTQKKVQQQEKTESSKFDKDMEEIAGLQRIFDEALGIESNGKEAIRSYNPVLARWKFEQLKTEEEIKRFKKYELKQMETNLRERYHAAQSIVNYTIDNEGNVYNELFPDEPFVEVLKRGVVYRREHGSPELEREEQELQGFIKNMQKLTSPNTPVGAKMICISPPGIVVDTTYKDNFVDFLEVRKNPQTGARTIQLTRFKSSMGYEEYIDILEQERPGFFDGKTGPIDAIILGEGIYKEDARTPHKIFAEKFGGPTDAMQEKDFRNYIYTPTVGLCINYIDELCVSRFYPLRVAKAFNATLVTGDAGKREWKKDQQSGERRDYNQNWEVRVDIRRYAQRLGGEEAEEIAAGCGPSSGFSVGKNPYDHLSNSVGKFGVKKDFAGENAKDDPSLCRCGGKEPHFHCEGKRENGEKCGHAIIVGSKESKSRQCSSCGVKAVC